MPCQPAPELGAAVYEVAPHILPVLAGDSSATDCHVRCSVVFVCACMSACVFVRLMDEVSANHTQSVEVR